MWPLPFQSGLSGECFGKCSGDDRGVMSVAGAAVGGGLLEPPPEKNAK